jgi:hypothetical protein
VPILEDDLITNVNRLARYYARRLGIDADDLEQSSWVILLRGMANRPDIKPRKLVSSSVRFAALRAHRAREREERFRVKVIALLTRPDYWR